MSVGYVAAQTASSTEEGTTPKETVPASGDVAGEATTTVEGIAAPESAPEGDATTESQEEASAPVEAQISGTEAAVGEIAGLEQDYMSKYGRYLQSDAGQHAPDL